MKGSEEKDSRKIVILSKEESLARDLADAEDYDGLRELAERILDSKRIVGSPDDYHNLAVNLAKLDEYELACLILQRGLTSFVSSVDLLADYLYYGIDCDGNREQCAFYYNRLRAIPEENWTWRGYSFTLDYLYTLSQLNENTEELENIWNEMEFFSKKYKVKYPMDERSYYAETKLYSRTNPAKEMELLEHAIRRLPVCPMCSLRYADRLIDQATSSADYQKALKCLKRALVRKTENDINLGYVYFLMGICCTQLLDPDRKDTSKSIKKVKEIHQYFRLAKLEELHLSSSYRKTIDKQLRILEELTRIPFEE